MVDARVGVVMAGAKHFSQLTVWQLADALRVEVLKLTRAPSCASDWKYRSQVEEPSTLSAATSPKDSALTRTSSLRGSSASRDARSTR
jgi:hypothetical protein